MSLEPQPRRELESSEAKLIVERERGARAKRLLDDPLFGEAIEALRNRAIQAFREADPNDDKALLLAKLRYLMAEDFLDQLVHHFNTGELAVQQLQIVQQQLARWRDAA